MNQVQHLARYRFTLAFEQPFQLPLFSGSMLRGIFGHALRHLCCMTRQKQCTQCPLINGCHYPPLFEPSLLADQTPQASPPYVIEPPLGPRMLAEGEHWTFNMVLMGPALPRLSMIILALIQAAAKGMGSHKVQARLMKVEVQFAAGWQKIYATAEPHIMAHDTHITLPAEPIQSAYSLTLLTPTRLLRDGRAVGVDKLQAPDLLGSLLRRVTQVAHYLELAPPAAMLVSQAQLKPISLRWQPWSRYSNRQKQAMQLDGIIGELHLGALPAALWPWLFLGQWLHIGKNCSFGLGHYQLASRVYPNDFTMPLSGNGAQP